MMITKNIQVEDKTLPSGGSADVRRGRYMGRLVAVRTMRVTEGDSLVRIKKVNISDIFSAPGMLSQPLCSSDSVRKLSSGARYLIQTS